MSTDAGSLRVTAVIAIFALLYLSRLSKGSARETPAGLVFAMKPAVIVARLAALALYLGFFGYTLATNRMAVPLWFPALFVLAIGFSLLQFPGTIVLGPEALTQHFWFLKQRTIPYEQVMSMQRYAAGRAIRVVGPGSAVITHTTNHSAQERFRTEMEQRTGQRVT